MQSAEVEWPGPLPRVGETLTFWGDEDVFTYTVLGVTHAAMATPAGDHYLGVSVYVGLYEEREPWGSAHGLFPGHREATEG